MNYTYTTLNQYDSNDGVRSNSDSSTMMLDWRKQLRTPPTYRLGNRTFRIHYHIALLCIFFGALILIFFGFKPYSQSSYSNKIKWYSNNEFIPVKPAAHAYNYTYPLTSAIISSGIQTYQIGLIADLDQASKDSTKSNAWRSYLKKGFLSYSSSKNSIVTTFGEDDKIIEMSSGYSLNGRGMELSELVTFNGNILTFDDRTGIVFKLQDNQAIPWILLMDGNGKTTKGFKSEWATVKDEILYVGSMGKEWTTSTGEFQSSDPMYVKAVTMTGEVNHFHNLIFGLSLCL